MKADFKSSIVTFLVAIPLCLGIALASNAPIGSGLIAGIIGGIVAGSLSGSQLCVSGPAAGLAVIVAGSIHQLGGYSNFALAVLLSGFLQIIFSIVRAGNLGSYFPTSVIKGMLSAIGLVLILKQIPHAMGFNEIHMGIESFAENGGGNTFHSILDAFISPDFPCLLIAALSLVAILLWDRYALNSKNRVLSSIPSPLIAVGLSILISSILYPKFGLEVSPAHMVSLPLAGDAGGFLSSISLPSWQGLFQINVYRVALTIALVGSIESLLSLDAADKIDPQKRISSKNRELFAQGISNAISGLLGGLPLTAVVVRTSANVGAGAKSKASAILHGFWILLSVLLIPQLLNRIPLSTLAVILMLVGYKLTKPGLYLKTFREGMDQFLPFFVTVVAILFTDLLIGICVGMLVGFYFVIKRNLHESIVMVSEDGDYLIRFMKDVSFLQKGHLSNLLRSIPNGSRLILDGSQDVFVDSDIIALIDDFVEGSSGRNISVELKKSTVALASYFKVQPAEVTNG